MLLTEGIISLVPHSAFSDPRVAVGGTPRASIEMGTIAYWFE
jgi:hypothetical protein